MMEILSSAHHRGRTYRRRDEVWKHVTRGRPLLIGFFFEMRGCCTAHRGASLGTFGTVGTFAVFHFVVLGRGGS